MRNAFADEITQLARLDKRVVLLSGDIGNKLFDDFKQVDPQRFYNCGIAEANMMGVAAGMALSGFRPIIYTITPFTTTRCFEQIRVDVCYHEAPVIIVGTGSGLSYTELGPTHHSLEDMAILRTLPGMCVMAPGDATELRLALRAALQQNHPVYIRIGKKGEPDIHAHRTQLNIGKVFIVREGTEIGILSAGTIITEVIKAADLLKEKGISAEVVSSHTIKPLDDAYLKSAAKRFKLLVTVEEHGLIGGLGGAVAEWSARENTKVPHLSIGTPDEFMHETGSQAYARKKYGLVADAIAERVISYLNN
ncbi:transketolase family protein [Aquicella lusitana]|uniref:Transketolase subunit B n=1 Tax=Aquicella lusitana TaxID=254246 RepID=A0A370GY26_9COXI|nr:transketolase C-terminal domain-containing protein [Aquicella lusitana]RDI48160.1 transketolase subunit B [Aquicella lusitana]VVC72824.1 1-deoxy-D-xylulose-5-phosphate synthase [Aquicella lusitana]